eukprot:TRINITY_DN17913_c0_g1_i1.p1 TRINITY_DN17913_c0_g1~~TRINITY_DN17913_c0_g1_i1.p1  ORF type:complete len:193 (+),score=55.67 TRINITY_DN17913_c0_g1_i1:321-899(+)
MRNGILSSKIRKKGQLRYVDYKGGYMWNYGALPQTWENPDITSEAGMETKGDNDPLDIIEIGSAVAQTGNIKQVQVLGVLAMIDEGETDWKIVGIDVEDPLYKDGKLNDIEDVEKVKPGYLQETMEWFRDYKTVVGKPQNTFGFGGQFQNKQFALSIIQENHHSWKQLMKNGAESAKNHGIVIDSSYFPTKQ